LTKGQFPIPKTLLSGIQDACLKQQKNNFLTKVKEINWRNFYFLQKELVSLFVIQCC